MARFSRDKDPQKAVEFWLTQAGLALISGWRQDGMSIKQIAAEMGVTYRCLRNWVKDYEELFKAVEFGVQEVQYQVEDALTRAAIGGKANETKITTLMKNGVVVETLKEQFTKEVPPDIRAVKLYLMNRAPHKWQQDKLALLTGDDDQSHIQVVVHKHITQEQDEGEEQSEV